MKKLALVLLFAMTMNPVLAKGNSNAKWYRYYENGSPKVSQTLTKVHRDKGYEELDASFRVIRKVEPYNATLVKAKKEKAEAEKVEAKKKKSKKEMLIKKYGTAKRAERKRVELLAGIDSKRRFAQQQVTTAESELKKELDRAANLEKTSKPVSKALKNNIAKKKKAVSVAQSALNDLVLQQYHELEMLTKDIRRLRRFERETASK